MKNKSVIALTEGAMFGAIYGVILLLVRFVFSATDSIIYYFIPIPLSIYVYRRGFNNGLLLTFVIALLSFLIVGPYHALLLMLPNIIIGLIFGLIPDKSPIFKVLLLFVLCLLADYLSVYAFRLITGVPYIDSMQSEMSFIKNLFPQITNELFARLLLMTLPIVLIIDSLMKAIIIIFMLKILKKFHNRDVITFKKNIYYSPYLVIVFILFVGLLFPVIYYGMRTDSIFWQIMICTNVSIVFILSIYLIYQAVFATSLYFGFKGKKSLALCLAFIFLIIFPLGIILGLILNVLQPFFYKNVSK